MQATTSSGLTVIFEGNSTNVCAINGTTLTMISLGQCSISASQSGNGIFSPASVVTQIINVIRNGQTLEMTTNSNPYLTARTPITVIASSLLGFDLNFISKTPDRCTLGPPQRTDFASPSFKIESLVTMVSYGICTITATVSGNEFYDSVVVTRNFQTNRISQSITFNLPTKLNFANFPYNLTATSSQGLDVFYYTDGSSVCTVSGSTLIMVSTGYCLITAFRNTDDLYTGASLQRMALLEKGAGTINIITPGLAAQQRGTPWVVETSDWFINLEATSNSGAQPYGQSYSSNVCTFTGLTLNIVGSGLCQFNIYAPATTFWSEANSRALEIYIRKI